jgi:hypothetical protein
LIKPKIIDYCDDDEKRALEHYFKVDTCEVVGYLLKMSREYSEPEKIMLKILEDNRIDAMIFLSLGALLTKKELSTKY